MNQRRWGTLFRAIGSFALFSFTAHAADSVAPGFALSRFEPAERGSRFFSLETLDWRSDGLPTLGLVADYAYKPLVIYRLSSTGEEEVITVARDSTLLHLGGGINVQENFRIGADLPVVLFAEGTPGQLGLVTYQPPQRSGLGDLRLSGDWRFYGSSTDSFRAALGLRIFLPTGDSHAYASDNVLRGTLQAQVAGEIQKSFVWSARLGVHLRGRELIYATGAVGSELQAAAALGWRALEDKLVVGPEVAASTAFAQPFTGASTSVDILFGGHYDVSPQWRLGLGLGRGATAALGSPAVRATFSLEWVPFSEGDPACKTLKDELKAKELAAARDAEERQKKEAELAAAKAAADKAEAERRAAEQLAAEKEKLAAAKMSADDDGDGIPNGEDGCPSQAGPKNVDKAKNGCPFGAVVGDQVVLDMVRFQTGSDVILAESNATLEKVLAALRALPATYRYRIEGHTDDRGPAAYNKDLSQRRAKSVVDWLAGKGFDVKRLEAVGFGTERPLVPNDSEPNRQANRRVEFHISNLEVKP